MAINFAEKMSARIARLKAIVEESNSKPILTEEQVTAEVEEKREEFIAYIEALDE